MMKTNFWFFVFLSVLMLSKIDRVMAQYGSGSPLSIGLETGLGLPNQQSPFAYGLSLHVFVDYKAATSLSILGSIGYTGLFSKDTSPIADYHIIPLKSTIKMFPIEEQVYLSCTVGAGFGLLKDTKTSFVFGGGVGYEWLTGYDLALKYEGYQQSKSSSSYQPINGQFIIGFSYHF